MDEVRKRADHVDFSPESGAPQPQLTADERMAENAFAHLVRALLAKRPDIAMSLLALSLMMDGGPTPLDLAYPLPSTRHTAKFRRHFHNLVRKANSEGEEEIGCRFVEDVDEARAYRYCRSLFNGLDMGTLLCGLLAECVDYRNPLVLEIASVEGLVVPQHIRASADA